MPLTAGTRLGPYEILSALGAGGMGEVYRARDTKLGRDVAIKVLPDLFADDPERLARFHREAQVLASLNHPNIAHIHGYEDSNGAHALVMELVEGPTLADRIAHGPVPLNEALPIAKQIAEALEAAHEQGIIHRDLKPANIKVREDGTVKVLDFGLAKLVDPISAGSTSNPSVTASPTITTPAMMTGVGVILGTAAYMSPEQARGKSVDKRADVWAFGCVLYEMLTGHRPFAGHTVSDQIAAVLEREPDWSLLPAATPASILRLLRRCLQKDLRKRLRDIGDAIVDFDGEVPYSAVSPGRRPLAVVAAALVAAVLGGGVGLWAGRLRAPRVAPTVTRLVIPLSSDDAFTGSGNRMTAISSDGRRIVYTANGRLYIRALDQLESTALSGTDAPPVTNAFGGRGRPIAFSPAFSPDGMWVVYNQDADIKKVSVGGGSPLTIATAPGAISEWSGDQMLVVRRSVEGQTGGIWRIPSAGGTPELLITLANNEWPIAPQLLPGGTEILFTQSPGNHWDDADIVIHSLKTGRRDVVVHGAATGRYLASGHLVYGRRGTLYAARLDLAAHRVVGPSVPMVPNVAQATYPGAWGGFEYSVSESGTLVYVPDAAFAVRRILVWVDRQGHEEPLTTEPRAYEYPRISPDGQRVLVEARDRESDLWTWDLSRSTLTRVTFGRYGGGPGIWTRDGRAVVYGPDRGGIINLFQQLLDRPDSAAPLVTSPNTQYADAFSADGRWLVYEETDPTTKFDLRLLAMDGGHASKPLLNAPYNEQNPDISPDGRWLAYQSDESGRVEIYVRPFPDVAAGRWQVSTDGGTRPLWSRDGRELFYLDGQRRLAVVSIDARTGFHVGAAQSLFDAKPYGVQGINRNFDAAPDGKRFIFTKTLPTPPDAKRLIVVENWQEELKRLVPTK